MSLALGFHHPSRACPINGWYLKEIEMKKVLLAVPFVMMLTACGTPSVEELTADKDLMKEAIAECTAMAPADAQESELCMNANKANMEIMTKMVAEASEAAQAQVADLQSMNIKAKPIPTSKPVALPSLNGK